MVAAGKDKRRMAAVLFFGVRGYGCGGDDSGWGVGGGTLGSWS